MLINKTSLRIQEVIIKIAMFTLKIHALLINYNDQQMNCKSYTYNDYSVSMVNLYRIY